MLKIKEMRLWEGLTQKQLADKIGLTAHNVGDWERGKAEPSISDLIKLACAFDCSVDALIGRTDYGDNVPESVKLNKDEIKLLKAFRELTPKAQAFIVYSAESLITF